MSIYPERNRRTGSYTGAWLIEVTTAGERHRARAETYDQAQRLEESLKSGHSLPEAPEEVLTIGKLHARAKEHMYRGCKDELNLSRRLAKAVAILGPNRALCNIRKPELEAFAQGLLATALSPKTVNRYLAALSGLLRWAAEADLIAGVPPIPWLPEPPGRKAYLPEHLTDPFLRNLEETEGPDYALVTEVLLYTGMRIGELQKLSPEDIDGDVIHLTVTKTDSPRSIPLVRGLGASLVRLIERGLPSYRSYLKALQRASEAVLAPMPITPHALRHTTATRLTAAEVPTLTVARIMGHRNLRTTQGYTHHETGTLLSALVKLTHGAEGARGQMEPKSKPRNLLKSWRPRRESNPRTRICRTGETPE